MIKILLGGSPCTHWSIAQKNRETEAAGAGWELFLNYLTAKRRFAPDLFLYENNKSAAQAIKDRIAAELNAPLQYINSALVSAQNRWRFYVHNFGDVPQPADRGILLKDVLESGQTWLEKAYALTTRCCGAIPSDTFKRHRHTMIAEPIPYSEKAYCLRASAGGKQGHSNIVRHIQSGGQFGYQGVPMRLSGEGAQGLAEFNGKPVYNVYAGEIDIKGVKYPAKLPDGCYALRKLTITECCRLQTLPDDYCRAVSDAQAYKGLGNGWTAEVITHLLSFGLRGVSRDEPLVVLSMYDGIGTGRYCLDRLGFKNVTYYAYEIDKHAAQVANSNYADIKQCGDAWGVRAAEWFLEGARA